MSSGLLSSEVSILGKHMEWHHLSTLDALSKLVSSARLVGIGEAGVWLDLTLSYIAIITAQPWTIFM